MTTSSASTWWEEEHASLRERAQEGREVSADAGPPFSDALLQLLADVEDAFTQTGTDTPGWEDLHRTGRCGRQRRPRRHRGPDPRPRDRDR